MIFVFPLGYICLFQGCVKVAYSQVSSGEVTTLAFTFRSMIYFDIDMTYFSFLDSSVDEESACNARDSSSIPGLGSSPREGKATHSSILAWRIPGTVQSIGLQRVRHNVVAFPHDIFWHIISFL